jgi:hypothetical protein
MGEKSMQSREIPKAATGTILIEEMQMKEYSY